MYLFTPKQRLFIFVKKIIINVILVNVNSKKLQSFILCANSFKLSVNILVKINFLVKMFRSIYKSRPEKLTFTTINASYQQNRVLIVYSLNSASGQNFNTARSLPNFRLVLNNISKVILSKFSHKLHNIIRRNWFLHSKPVL